MLHIKKIRKPETSKTGCCLCQSNDFFRIDFVTFFHKNFCMFRHDSLHCLLNMRKNPYSDGKTRHFLLFRIFTHRNLTPELFSISAFFFSPVRPWREEQKDDLFRQSQSPLLLLRPHVLFSFFPLWKMVFYR